jgi:ribose/xylose/arabinose/galactoside ABC-type transport system permease subunit
MKTNSPDSIIPTWFPVRGQDIVLFLTLLCVICATAVIDKNHIYWNNPKSALLDNLREIAPLGLMAVGVTVVIIGGGIDLSVASTGTFATMVALSVMKFLAPDDFCVTDSVSPVVYIAGFLAAIFTGFSVGTLHAWMITSLQIPPFIATLGTLVGLRSFARALSKLITKTYNGSASSRFEINDPLFQFLFDNIYVSILVFLSVAFIVWFYMAKTVVGRHVYALGGNEAAARLSGIRTENIKWFMYCISSILASMGGFFYTVNSFAINTETLAAGKELNAIAAAVVGGCSLQGGLGTILGTVLGVFFLQAVVDSVAKIVKTDSATYEGLIVGVVVVLAVTIGQLRQHGFTGRQFFGGMLGWVTIPVLALFIALMTTVASGKGIVGIGLGCLSGVLFVVIKLLESRSPKASSPNAS